MHKQLLFVFLIMAISVVTIQAGDYQAVRVFLRSGEDLENLARLGVDFEGSHFKKDAFIDLQVSRLEKSRIEGQGYRTEILIEDVEAFYASRLETRVGEGFGYGSMGGYYTYTEVMANLDSMIFLYPHLISRKDTIGYSILGKPIVAVRISDNPNIQENEPEVLFTGLHHAREPVSMMTIVYYMWYLLENYGTDLQSTFLVENRQLWFVPVVNPDGYVHNQQTNPGGGGMWRLNARDNNDNGVYFQSGIDGVDLNRNYGYQWGYNNTGSSPNPGSSTYRGPFAFSEVETQTIRNFSNGHLFRSAFNYHTYSNLLIHPWAYNDSQTPDHQFFYTFGVDMTRFNGYTLGTPSQTVGYSVNGDSNDWMYGEQTTKPKILAYTPEVGGGSDGFWPPTNRILPLVQENLYPNLVLSYIAGSYPRLAGSEIIAYGYNRAIDPGDLVDVTARMTNYGLQSSGPLNVQLIPLNPQVQVLNDQSGFPTMITFDTTTAIVPWQFRVNYQTPVGSELAFQLLVFENGILVNTDSLSLLVGSPDTAFIADAESGLPPLTTGGTGGTWGITTGSSHSPTRSYTDSPSGSYGNNADFWLRTPLLSLANAERACLTYWTRWDIEDEWDFGIVEISVNNGVSWNHLVGNHMNPASGSGRQTTGLHGYDGVRTDWVQERIELSAYAGQQIQIRFRLMTDGSVTEDGWYVDDITLEIIDSNANVPPFISGATSLNYQPYTGNPYAVEAVILDDNTVDHASLFYSLDNGQTFSEVTMTGSDSLYSGNIPPLAPGVTVSYYIQAWDTSGAYGIFPYDAPASLLPLVITGSGPVLIVEPVMLNFTVPQLSSGTHLLKMSNPGTDPLTYQITDSTIQMESTMNRENFSLFPDTKFLSAWLNTAVLQVPVPESVPVPAEETGNLFPIIVITDSTGDTNNPGGDIVSVDFSENFFSYTLSITFSAAPDTSSLGIISVDVDQNFATGAYPPPFGFGMGNFDMGSEYDILFDFANLVGDTAGLPPSGYVFDVSDSNTTLLGIPIPLQINGNNASLTLPKVLFSIFDNSMNLSAAMLPLSGLSIPDMAPDYGHGLLGGELGSSWIAQLRSNGTSSYPLSGTIPPGDSTRIAVKVAAAYPTGMYQGRIRIANSSLIPVVEVPVTMTITAPGVPRVTLDPSAISDTLQQTSGIRVYPVHIGNSGTAVMYFSISDSVYNGSGWLTTDPPLGIVLPGESTVVDVSVDPTGLNQDSLYQAQLIIVSNDPSTPQILMPVSIFIETPTQIVVGEQIPAVLAMYANYPNPFNPSTVISFDLPGSSPVRLEVFNILGQRVTTLVNGNLAAGKHRYTWTCP